MILGRALWERLRPQRLSPRELQEQFDMCRIAEFTMAYQRAREGREVQHSKIEQEVAALKPAARKTRVQSALNEQVDQCDHADFSPWNLILMGRWPRQLGRYCVRDDQKFGVDVVFTGHEPNQRN